MLETLQATWMLGMGKIRFSTLKKIKCYGNVMGIQFYGIFMGFYGISCEFDGNPMVIGYGGDFMAFEVFWVSPLDVETGSNLFHL